MTDKTPPPKPPPTPTPPAEPEKGGEPTMKDAVTAARRFLRELEQDKLVKGPIQDLVLEGVRGGGLTGGDWTVILGYRLPNPLDSLMMGSHALAGLAPKRSEFYKLFVVDRRSGQVTAMAPYEPD